MFKHLLVPLDGTTLAEEVLQVAAELAQAAGAKITLLHVLEQDAPKSVHGQTHLSREQEAEDYLRATAQKFFPPGISVDWHVHPQPTRHLAAGLIDHALEMGPDLLLMRDHGRSRFRDWLYGNIAQQAYQGVDIPLFLFRPSSGLRQGSLFRRILAPVDFQPEHQRGLAVAEGLARLGQAAIRLLTVVPDPESFSGEKAATCAFLPRSTQALFDLALQDAGQKLTALRHDLSSRGLKVEAVLARGRPPDVIVDQAKEFQAEVIIMGAHGRAGSQAFWEGSVAATVVFRSETSLILVPPVK